MGLTPGFLRSEEMLDKFGVPEGHWQDDARVDGDFIASESPFYVSRSAATRTADREAPIPRTRVVVVRPDARVQLHGY